MTLRHKILTRTYVLTVLMIFAISLTYYALFTRDIRERSQQNVTMTYVQIFEDLHNRIDMVQSQLDHFVQDSVVNPISMVQMLQNQEDPSTSPSLWYLSRVLGYLRTLIMQMDDFGTLVNASRIDMYGKDRSLIAVYRQEGERTESGVYLPQFNPDAFIPFAPEDRWYAMLQEASEIPQQPFPATILPSYQGQIPDSTSVAFSSANAVLSMRFIVPVIQHDALQGLCVLELAIRQSDVERYARLSGTEVNVFAGKAFSVGTLPEYRSLADDVNQTTVQKLSEPFPSAFPDITISSHKLQGESYYQGLLALTRDDALVGAISVLFPRQLEERQKTRFFLVIAGIAAVFSLLAVIEAIGLSSSIARPIMRLMAVMHTVETGRFDVTAPVDTQDEIGKLATTFNTMTAQINSSFAKIDQQNRELKRLDKLKDEFLSNTSHELRTPLHGIAGLSEIILREADGPITDEARAHLQMIVQSSKRMGRLVDALLDFSKVRSETLQLHRSPFPLSEAMNIVTTFFKEMFIEKPVELKVDLPVDLPEIYGDIERVEQILTNLIGNAFKFTQEGTITVAAQELTSQAVRRTAPLILKKEGEQELSCPGGRGVEGDSSLPPISSQVGGPGGEFVQITVTDTGIGIPANALDRIFHSFEQVDGSSTRQFGGTGLGLAITKELVELHGGEILVDSTEGQGSTFTVLLPCGDLTPKSPPFGVRSFTADSRLTSTVVSPSQEEISGSRSGSNNTKSPPERPGDEGLPIVSGQGRTILIIDDDGTNVDVLRTYFEQTGFSVMTASDGQHAFEVINGFEIDLIMCDVMMPLVDGYTFATRMREHERLRDIPLIFISAKGRKSDMLRGYQAGGIEYLTKPVDRETLLLKVSAILSQQQRVRERYVSADAVRSTNHVYETNHDKEEAFTHVPSGHGERILVVDDEPINIEVYKTHLAQHGYNVLAASNGPDALDVIDREQPDMVLLDLMMPTMSGFRVCQILRQEKHLHHLPVIMLTAKSHIYDKVYGLNVGANDYLVKPFHPDELLTRMRVLLNTTALQQELLRKHEDLYAEILEREHAEEALRASEERYRAIADTALDSIFCKDTERRYTFINPAMERLFNMPAKALLGKTLEELFEPATAAIIARADTTALSGETVSEIQDFPIQGDLHTFHAIQVPLRDSEGRIIGISGIMRDITSQRQAEEEIRQLNEELELRVKQRTTELEASNRELKDFAYVVSHDLKAPLRGISRLANWLTQDYADTIDDKGREMADLLIGRVKRMDTLIDGILAYSRVGRVEEYKETLDLNSLVNDVIESLSMPPHIQVSITTPLPVIMADRIRIIQVFQNLLSNAVKFLDKPEGKITIHTNEEDACWRFSVTDNGPGIDAKYHKKVFQIFQTLTPRDESESTGVGLSIVKKIIELQGGEIWLESQPEKGATFFFTMPKT